MSSRDQWVVGDLFSGIGGFSLAARWMGWRTLFFSEVDPYASRVLAKRFPGVPNLGDIREIDGTAMPPLDVLCGGFPCQDISLAGKGAGINGARSGLWTEFARLIGEIRPRWVVAENVAALRTRGLDKVLADLAAIGYDAEWHCIPASAVGAPHQRDRIWIVARPTGEFPEPVCVPPFDGRHLGDAHGEPEHQHVRGGGPERGGAATSPRAVDAVDAGLRDAAARRIPGWASEPDVGRVAHGVPHRVDRLRCLGNAIVPQVAYYLFRQILKAETAAATAAIPGLIA